jgi:hypothetical protein
MCSSELRGWHGDGEGLLFASRGVWKILPRGPISFGGENMTKGKSKQSENVKRKKKERQKIREFKI